MEKKGIVIVPVADLTFEPIQEYYTHQPPNISHALLPWAPFKRDYSICPRGHQLLYHEIVTILEKKGEEVHIQIPNVFYHIHDNQKPQHTYWTLKKNILPLSESRKKNTFFSKLPNPISFSTDHPETNYYNTISLVEPFTVPSLGITFSAGTRFIKTEKQPDKNNILVYYVHPKKHTIKTITLPSTIIHEFYSRTMEDRVADFLAILHRWSQYNNGVIPYVLGGCSFTDRWKHNEFTKKETIFRGKTLNYYVRPSETASCKTGFDCSGLIVRAAQIAGLPYYCKNTTTLAQQLPVLAQNEELKNGDLIWIQGHVLILANRAQNSVIEAASYDSGHGKIQEIPISSIFKGVDTVIDLEQKHCAKAPLQRIDHNGQLLEKYSTFKLLKFASTWL